MRTRSGLAVFWLSALVVGAVALTPQAVGGLLAGNLPLSLSARAVDFDIRQFQADFRRAADQTRLIVLLSPT